MPSFRNINITGSADELPTQQARLRGLSRTASPDARRRVAEESPAAEQTKSRLARSNDDTAGRMLLQTFLEDAGQESLLEVTSPALPEAVPDMQLQATSVTPQLSSNTVTYRQLASNIPIFGGRVVVDMDNVDKTLVSINGKVAPLPDISPLAQVSPAEAWQRLLTWSGASNPPAAPPAAPVLNWHLDEDTEKWRLVHHFANVPLPPKPEPLPPGLSAQGQACCRPSLHARAKLYDYFVDAHTGEVAFYFPSTRTLDVPTPLFGTDYNNIRQTFFGITGSGKFFLIDPLRNIETYDYNFQDLDATPMPAFPPQAISNSTHDFGTTSPQAVCAHFNATVVYDFYNNEMKRDGIDDKGMKLISAVNVYSSDQNPNPPPEWGNAVWSQGKMWYGQENGTSFARHLDIIAHELTHGVTETSSNLIYRRLSGALNESFSDIFGIIIMNWSPGRPNAVSTWRWELGPGIGQNGGPIRNLADPAAAGQPDHMNQYQVLPLSFDAGGVHIYSGIHNKAVYLLLTNKDAAGQLTFPTSELVLLLYLTLTRLTPTSVFADSRRTLENVTSTYHAADATTRTARLAAIKAAFDAVGIV
jgi:bacillolysin